MGKYAKMAKCWKNINEDQLRSYSSAFSRNVFSDIANFSDFSQIDWMLSRFNEKMKDGACYLDYFSYIYSVMSKAYRNEYVYKNEIINQLLIKKYGTKNTIAFNEFKVGDSIVDFAMMNGESKAFEIKTTLDSPKRLEKQMNDYKRLFNKCYIVIDESECDYYAERIDETIGIVALRYRGHKVVLEEYRSATKHDLIDASCMMKCLRTSEYKNIVENYFGSLPDVASFEMFVACEQMIKKIPFTELNRLFLAEVKKRSSITESLISFPKELRQMMLAMNLPKGKQKSLLINLNKPIKRDSSCIVRI